MTNDTDLLKSIVLDRERMAKITHYCDGNLYYSVKSDNGNIYQFPVNVFDRDDIGTTTFFAEIKAATLMRYIRKAIQKEELIDVTSIK